MENKVTKQMEFTKPTRVKLTENNINMYFSKIDKLPILEQLKNVDTVNKLLGLGRLQNFNTIDKLPSLGGLQNFNTIDKLSSLEQLKTDINLQCDVEFAYYDKVTNWLQENKKVKKWFDYTPEKWNEIVEEFNKLPEEKQKDEQIAFYLAL